MESVDSRWLIVDSWPNLGLASFASAVAKAMADKLARSRSGGTGRADAADTKINQSSTTFNDVQ
jgi:hypothetical protein